MYDSTQTSYGQNVGKRKTKTGSRRQQKRERRVQKRQGVWKCVCGLSMAFVVGAVSLLAAENVWAASDGMISGNVAEPEKTEVEKAKEEMLNLEALRENMKGKIEAAIAAEPGVPVIVVDAGHGGEDEGCARAGVCEKDINLAIARLVRDRLNGLGYQVIMTREDDTYIAKEDRVKLANESNADLYISIHQNASDETEVEGIEVWYEEADIACESRRLALLVGQQTVKKTGAPEREYQGDSQIHVIENTNMPSCLIETGFLSNAGERSKLVTAEYQAQIADGIVQGIEYYLHPKTMYLTFDDGPHEENTSRVLDILKERNIKATFFVVGENVRKYPELMQRIVAEGHAIGVHCNNHDYDSLYQSVDSYVADFEQAHQAVLEVTGVDTKLFRFPGGSVNAHNQQVSDDIIEEMTKRGYIYYDWNASIEDAVKDPQPEQLLANGVSSTFGREKVIMLAHDVVYSTGICLNDLLDCFPEYQMEVLTEAVGPVQF